MNANGAVMAGIDARFDDVDPEDLVAFAPEALGDEVDQGQVRRGMAKISDANFHFMLLPAFWAGKGGRGAETRIDPGDGRLIPSITRNLPLSHESRPACVLRDESKSHSEVFDEVYEFSWRSGFSLIDRRLRRRSGQRKSNRPQDGCPE
jgi:hypothetical protein